MRPLIVALMTLSVVACGRSVPTDTDKAASGAGAASALQAGLWESRVEILSVKPLPIETAQGSYTPKLVSHSPPTTSQSCLIEQLAAEPFRQFLVGGAPSECDHRGFNMENGRIQGSVSCKMMDEQTTYRIEGQYTATSYDVTTQAEVRAGGGQAAPMMPTVTPMDMTSRVTGHRLGNCPASAEGKAP
jgi:uncharacterized protein DUF3617